MSKKAVSSATMEDVAQRAGVGLATVGRVLHRRGYVAEATRTAVEKAIADLGYVPNLVARNLKRRRTRLWAHLTVFNPNQLFFDISRAVDAAAGWAGYRVVTVATHRDQTPLDVQLRDLIEQQIEGLLVTSHAEVTPELLAPVLQAGLPVVMIERTHDLPGVDRVVVQDYRGAHDAVAHLLSSGAQRVAFLGRDPGSDVERRRLEGYRAALVQARRSLDPALEAFVDDYAVASGRIAAARLLALSPRPDAVFCGSDLLAAGVLQEAYARGLRVPTDLRVVGYDDTLAATLSPPLTSMGLPLEEIGRRAVELLVHRLDQPGQPPRLVTVRPRLIDRGTGRA